VDELVAIIKANKNFNSLRQGFKLYKGDFPGTPYFDEKVNARQYHVSNSPAFDYFAGDASELGQMKLVEVGAYKQCDLTRRLFFEQADKVPMQKLVLKFEQVDTEELRNVEIEVNGESGIYKVGDGETSHYHIPNDKKLWETQFMICSIGGRFYIRDMGFVHTTRMKLDTQCKVQIQKGSVVDLGKVVHYHFDKVVHNVTPIGSSLGDVIVLRENQEYEVDPEDFPTARARPTWVSNEESPENIQNEITLYADGSKDNNTIGRSNKRDIQIKLKAVSADHCSVRYTQQSGWTISESGKDRPSSNGTYIFLKTQEQMKDHMPSDLIPLQNNMVLSFVNYEVRIMIQDKTPGEIEAETIETQKFYADRAQMVANLAAKASFTKATPVPEEKEEFFEVKSAAVVGSVAPLKTEEEPAVKEQPEPVEEHKAEETVEEA
jgi:pSer/pThr/pTyr-binding forkhead associated (FHA) protein